MTNISLANTFSQHVEKEIYTDELLKWNANKSSSMYIFEDLLENKVHEFVYQCDQKQISEEDHIDALENQTKYREYLYQELHESRTKVEKEIIQKQIQEIDLQIRDVLQGFHLMTTKCYKRQ